MEAVDLLKLLVFGVPIVQSVMTGVAIVTFLTVNDRRMRANIVAVLCFVIMALGSVTLWAVFPNVTYSSLHLIPIALFISAMGQILISIWLVRLSSRIDDKKVDDGRS
jgi:FtsH-binding integral membrane protein